MKRAEEFIKNLNFILEKNFHREDFGVQELSKELSISRSQLHRKIKAFTGITTSAYVNEFRLKKAAKLLSEGKFNISEISYMVGFNSPSYFSTTFKKYFNHPPNKISSIDPNLYEQYPWKENIEDISPGNFINHKKSKILAGSLVNRLLVFGLFGLIIIPIIFYSINTRDTKEILHSDNDKKSIAILPLKDFSKDQSLDWFCYGLTDELISRFSEIYESYRVISQTTSFKFKETNLSALEIASQLQVDYIFEGIIQKTKDRFKVNMQLIDANQDDHVWTDQFAGNWKENEIFEIQNSITSFVTGTLQSVLVDDKIEYSAERITEIEEAYKNYLQGVYYAYKEDEINMQKAQEFLQRAISLDPNFAKAYSELGYVYMFLHFDWDKATYYLNKAKILDPHLLRNNLYYLQGLFYFEWDFENIEKFLKEEFQSHTFDRETSGLLDYALKTGRPEIALETINRSIESNPMDAVLYSFKAKALIGLERKEEAELLLKQMDSINGWDYFYLRGSSHCHLMLENYEEASKIIKLISKRFEYGPDVRFRLLFISHLEGDMITFNKLKDEIFIAYENQEGNSPSWFKALYYISIEQNIEKTFECLERSFERKETELLWLTKEPFLASIRTDSRYLGLCERVGFNNFK